MHHAARDNGGELWASASMPCRLPDETDPAGPLAAQWARLMCHAVGLGHPLFSTYRDHSGIHYNTIHCPA